LRFAIAGFVALQGVSSAKSKGANLKVKVPTSLGLSIGVEMFYSGGPVIAPNGKVVAPVAYGYARFLTYTVLDQNMNALKQSGWQVVEQVDLVSQNTSDNSAKDSSKTVAVASDGSTFGDVQVIGTTVPPPPQPGQYVKYKQYLAVFKPGQAYLIRINCLDQESSDVTITDTTNNPNNACQ
jgi:hypothetical protein